MLVTVDPLVTCESAHLEETLLMGMEMKLAANVLEEASVTMESDCANAFPDSTAPDASIRRLCCR